MTRPRCKHAHSGKQLRFFGAVAVGRPTKKTSMSPAEAKHHISRAKKEGWNVSKIMGKAIRGKRRSK